MKSPLKTNQVKAIIESADDPSGKAKSFGQKGGRNAHRILDWATLKSPLDIWVKTARFGWHPATEREKRILKERRNKI
jgi:hypothetical protein